MDFYFQTHIKNCCIIVVLFLFNFIKTLDHEMEFQVTPFLLKHRVAQKSRNRFVFLTCVSRCQLQFVGQNLGTLGREWCLWLLINGLIISVPSFS